MTLLEDIHHLVNNEDHAGLARLIHSDPEARRLYIRYMSDTATLHLRPAEAPARQSVRSWSARMAWVTAACALVAAATLVWRTRETAPTYRGVATLAQTVGAQWEVAPRGVIAPGTLRLKQGLAQIEFFSGATVVVEGPATLDLVSSMEIALRSGRVRATVPPSARGFTINGSGVGVVDLGTEFGISVDNAGSQLQIFEGEVELVDKNRRLKAGDNLAVTAAGTPRDLVATTFVDRAGFARRVDEANQHRQERWRAHSETLRRDSSLLLYYTFEDQDPWDRMLNNRAARAEGKAAIVGCRWTSGRWPAKKALQFKQPGDRVRFAVPGQFDSMTLAAWVRFDGFDRRWISLLLTDDFDRGEPHWQVSREGEMILGVGGPGNHISPPVLSQMDLGRWLHLATVYDRGAETVTHYLDGRPVGRNRIKGYIPLVVGPAEIGNWGLPLSNHVDRIRNLNGAIDELAVFARALSDDEVAGLYQSGLPP